MSQPTNPTPPPINPYDVPEPRRPGMSGTSKVLLGLGVGCGVLVILCCGFLGLSTYAIFKVAGNWAIRDPAKIQDITDEIVSIDIPPSMHPKVALDMRIPFLGDRIMMGAVYSDTADDSHLLLGQICQSFIDKSNLESQLRQSIRDSHRGKSDDIDIQESEPFESKIHDEPARFTISRGIGRESQDEFWEVIGHFRGKEGPAMLILQAKSPNFTKDQVLDMLKSMK